MCKHFSKEEGCRFKEDCAYMHEDSKSIQQKEINNALSVVVTKHNLEMKVIQKEVMELKDTIVTMQERLGALENQAQQVTENRTADVQKENHKESETTIEDVISYNNSSHKEPEKISVEESDSTNGKSNKKGKKWIYCDICSYKCRSDNVIKKHIMTKHMKIKKCAMCVRKFDDDTLLADHIEKDHNQSNIQLNVSQNSDDDMVERMELLQRELDADNADNMSDVSLDEERHEALDREMNPSDYI